MAERPSTATSPLLRRLNAAAVLDALRSAESMTGTDVMAATGLSRPTVHTVCDELIDLGWVHELDARVPEDPRRPGRRARHYAFRARAAYVLGVDLGAHKVTVQLADLAGDPVAERTCRFREELVDVDERLRVVQETVTAVLARGGVGEAAVLAVGLGVPGPTEGGRVCASWLPGLDGADLPAAVARGRDWRVLVENDANLAVIAERWRGAARAVDDVVLLLAGERLGSGVFVGGRLLRGAHGGVGELGFLHLVAEVGNTDGIGRLTARLGADAVASRDEVQAEPVFAAARDGDPAAQAVVDAVAARVARVVAVLATLFDPELLVVGGAVAGAGDVVLDPLARHARALCERPPRLVASALGERAVVTGAVRLALDDVEAGIFDRGALRAAVPSDQAAHGPIPGGTAAR
jgi:predicted NBD/HSP70 family sugar kinase